MKKIVFLVLLVGVLSWLVIGSKSIFSCVSAANKINSAVDSTTYYKAKCDSLTFISLRYEKFLVNYENENKELVDSIAKLNVRPIMSVDQFMQLYKYNRLVKYYKICKYNPTQWKFYKGWSTRVFEE